MMMHTKATSPFKLFQQIVRPIYRTTNEVEILELATEALGWNFGVDRAIALSLDDQDHELEVAAEYCKESIQKLGKRRYQLRNNSEWFRLLAEGRPLPLTQIQSDANQASINPELDALITDSGSKAVLAFPLVSQGVLLGCITVHFNDENRSFSDELLEIGEAFADEVSNALKLAQLLCSRLEDGKVFSGSTLPMVVLERTSFRIAQTNSAAAQLLDGTDAELRGLPFLELFGESDAMRIREAVSKLDERNPVTNLPAVLVPTGGGQTASLDAAISMVEGAEPHVAVALLPAIARKASPAGASTAESTARVEELAGSLSKQLNWERMIRQIVSKLHSSLDRDTVLQFAADAVGRALRASTCLIVRTDSPASSIVTHEYADPNLSPLGLGRSGMLPPGLIASVKQRTTVVGDLSGPSRPPGISKEDQNALLDNGVGALLSTPIVHHGAAYGVIVVESSEARDWSGHEVEMLETIASQAAQALSNAQAFAQVKDQLFNMNLISNLTQQLTNALDQAGRNARAERPEPVMEAPSTPLSSRELEVLKLIASGLANREIAQKLFLTESTVELHASRIRKKLKLKSRTALVKYACDNHLV